MKKLMENLDDMIWEEIFKVDSKDFEKIEKKLGIKFPENDIKYLKVFNCGKSVNVIFNIENEKFYLKFDTLEYKYFNKNLDYFHESTGNYFANRKIVPVISKTNI